MKNTTINKLLCTAFILVITAQSSFAVQNYSITTTTSENYSASSPVGTFENYSSSGVINPAYTTTTTPAYNYHQTNTTISTPSAVVTYNTPVYSTGIEYATNAETSQNYSYQDIRTPQAYNKTVTTTTTSVDTREKADKIIDRGTRILLPLAAIGAAVGFIISVL